MKSEAEILEAFAWENYLNALAKCAIEGQYFSGEHYHKLLKQVKYKRKQWLRQWGRAEEGVLR